jgi:hypothetical protein
LYFPKFSQNDDFEKDLQWRDITLNVKKSKITVIRNYVEPQKENSDDKKKDGEDTRGLTENHPNTRQINNNNGGDSSKICDGRNKIGFKGKKKKKRNNNQKKKKKNEEYLEYEALYQFFLQKQKKKITEEEDLSNDEKDSEVQDVRNARTPRGPRGVGQKCRYVTSIWFCSTFTKKDVYRVLGCWGLSGVISFLEDKNVSDSGSGRNDGGLAVELTFFDKNFSSVVSYFDRMKLFIDSNLINIGETKKEEESGKKKGKGRGTGTGGGRGGRKGGKQVIEKEEEDEDEDDDYYYYDYDYDNFPW